MDTRDQVPARRSPEPSSISELKWTKAAQTPWLLREFTATDRVELDAAIAAVEARLVPATRDEITKIIAKIALACRHPAGDEIDRKAQAALYVEYLAEFPADALRRAADDWIARNVFFPAISEIRSTCWLLVSGDHWKLAKLRELRAKKAP